MVLSFHQLLVVATTSGVVLSSVISCSSIGYFLVIVHNIIPSSFIDVLILRLVLVHGV